MRLCCLPDVKSYVLKVPGKVLQSVCAASTSPSLGFPRKSASNTPLHSQGFGSSAQWCDTCNRTASCSSSDDHVRECCARLAARASADQWRERHSGRTPAHSRWHPRADAKRSLYFMNSSSTALSGRPQLHLLQTRRRVSQLLPTLRQHGRQRTALLASCIACTIQCGV